MSGFFRRFVPAALLCVLVCLSPASALEDVPALTDEETASVEVSDDRPIVVNIEVNNPAPVETVTESPAVEETIEEPVSVPEYPVYKVFSVNSSGTDSIPPDSVQSALTALLGSYTPRTQTVTEHLSDGTSVTYEEYVPGVAGLDWDWLCSVAIFALMLFCLFRLLGGVMKYG